MGIWSGLRAQLWRADSHEAAVAVGSGTCEAWRVATLVPVWYINISFCGVRQCPRWKWLLDNSMVKFAVSSAEKSAGIHDNEHYGVL